VAIRARNPCLLIRRLLRGRYDGFIRKSSQVSRGSYLGESDGVKLRTERTERTEHASKKCKRAAPRGSFFFPVRPFRPLRLLRRFSPVKTRLTFQHLARNISRP
jgi:hypothetical protein